MHGRTLKGVILVCTPGLMLGRVEGMYRAGRLVGPYIPQGGGVEHTRRGT